MRIHCLQHVPFEGLGYIDHWARRQQHTVTRTAMFNDEPLPDNPSEWDGLVILGGPMGVGDSAEFAWLTREKQFIAKALNSGKPVLGICLGAQLIADVAGARVYRNQHKEIGWHEVYRNQAVEASAAGALFPERFFAFHWHGDTFDLPPGATHLASSEACRQQAFFYPPATVGLQFHLESTVDSIEALLVHCGHEVVEGPFIQNTDRIRNQTQRITASNAIMQTILDFWEKTSPISASAIL